MACLLCSPFCNIPACKSATPGCRDPLVVVAAAAAALLHLTRQTRNVSLLFLQNSCAFSCPVRGRVYHRGDLLRHFFAPSLSPSLLFIINFPPRHVPTTFGPSRLAANRTLFFSKLCPQPGRTADFSARFNADGSCEGRRRRRRGRRRRVVVVFECTTLYSLSTHARPRSWWSFLFSPPPPSSHVCGSSVLLTSRNYSYNVPITPCVTVLISRTSFSSIHTN